MKYNISIDIGGTFTDAAIMDVESGALWTAKTPSTPDDLSRGFMAGVRRGMERAGGRADEILRMFHGTTIATNAVIERRTANIGLLTTAGFKYVLEIGRHDIPRGNNIYAWVKPERPAPPDRIFEARERLDRAGEVLTPLDEEDCRAAARAFRDMGVEAVAVCFLYSYANDSHERRAAEILRETLGAGVPVSLSSEVLPQFREFERTVATALNACVTPRVGRYLANLESASAREGIRAPLFIMKSNGGLASADIAARQAIHTVLSGPVAGVMGASRVSVAAGFPDFISLDVGGTSADICLARGGQPDMTASRAVGGLPLQMPMLDIAAIGAGGGSVARASSTGALTVGPQSAGADPGPACYALGGDAPTVTDARLALGHLPAHLLGGELPLSAELARRAVREKVAEPLGVSVEDAAAGIIEIADNNMAGAMRAVSIGRGLDPADFALTAFGGAGPLHACALAALLGIETVIIPPTPGALSGYGLLFTDLRNDYAQTFVHAGDPEPSDVEAAYRRLEQEADEWLERQAVPESARLITRAADLRYRHQGWEITVEAPAEVAARAALDEMEANFHALHKRLYTYNLPHQKVELVNLRVAALGRLPRAREAAPPPAAPSPAPAPFETRRVIFSPREGGRETPVYRREDLSPGMVLPSPAVIQQADSTTLIPPGFAARVDGAGNLLIGREGGGKSFLP